MFMGPLRTGGDGFLSKRHPDGRTTEDSPFLSKRHPDGRPQVNVSTPVLVVRDFRSRKLFTFTNSDKLRFKRDLTI